MKDSFKSNDKMSFIANDKMKDTHDSKFELNQLREKNRY